MAIQTLSHSAVRAIGAAQVVTSPASVVKELIDNALDAGATSISVEISSNTIDSIQVRDNGHGIPPADRSLAARPHCTSKLSNDDDLKCIGGSTLGFRGEALASVAEMSGSLTLSTRVEGEQVAAVLNVNQQGEVTAQERGSLPVGTTVKVTNLMKFNPVRKQVALKNSEKCLNKVKQVLQSYAFARLSVRISLRVLKAKTDKQNLMYAPKPGGSAEDAAFKIVGAACASQCTRSVMEDNGFTLRGFLPKPDADVGKISNIGAFLSVDARPVSTARGTPKQILKIFREALKGADNRFDGVKEPFLCLEIGCPLASYDANFEPAKDDILFEEPESILNAARRLFESVYSVKETTNDRRAAIELQPQEQFESPGPSDHLQYNRSRCVDEPQVARSNMYGYDDEDMIDLPPAAHTTGSEDEMAEMRHARKDVTVNNPWTTAKLHAVSRSRLVEQSASADQSDFDASLEERSCSGRGRRIDLEAPGLPTPQASSSRQSSPAFHPSKFVPDVRLAGDGRVIGSQSLPPPQPLSSPIHPDGRAMMYSMNDSSSPSNHLTIRSESVPPAGTSLDAIPEAPQRRRGPTKHMRQQPANRPFVSPLKATRSPKDRVWFDHLEPNLPARQRPKEQRTIRPADNDGLVVRGELGDLAEDACPLTPPARNRDLRDYLTSTALSSRRGSASMYRRAQGQTEDEPLFVSKCAQPDLSETTDSPTASLTNHGFVPASKIAALQAHSDQTAVTHRDKRRKSNDNDVLREVDGNATGPNTHDDSLPSPASRKAHPSRRKTTDGKVAKPSRRQTSRLPLERVPAGQGMQNIICNQTTSSADVSRLAMHIEITDSLPRYSEPARSFRDAFDFDDEDMRELVSRLKGVLVSRVSDEVMVQDLQELVRKGVEERGEAFSVTEEE